ncbi:proline--tRNA ligase, partial [Patescibacteria group bacterium]|nr:proline--tRNA ligase [Patescibacteria group bacterium]
KMLENQEKFLYERAKKNMDANIRMARDYGEFKDLMRTKKGFIKAFWCEGERCEAKIKEETKATTRLLPLDAKEEAGKCIYCGAPSKHIWYFAQAY